MEISMFEDDEDDYEDWEEAEYLENN